MSITKRIYSGERAAILADAAPELVEALHNLVDFAWSLMKTANKNGEGFDIEAELKPGYAALAKAKPEPEEIPKAIKPIIRLKGVYYLCEGNVVEAHIYDGDYTYIGRAGSHKFARRRAEQIAKAMGREEVIWQAATETERTEEDTE